MLSRSHCWRGEAEEDAVSRAHNLYFFDSVLSNYRDQFIELDQHEEEFPFFFEFLLFYVIVFDLDKMSFAHTHTHTRPGILLPQTPGIGIWACVTKPGKEKCFIKGENK